MRTSEHLYGKNYDRQFVQENLSVNYRKIIWAKELIIELQDVPVETRDFKRIYDVVKSIDFNQKIIDEANEK